MKEHIDFRIRCVLQLVAAIALVLVSSTAVLAATVTATWNANPETSVTGYVLSYGTSSGSYTTNTDVGNVTSRQLTLSPGRYYFAVRAYNASAQMSPYSTQVMLDVPSSPVPGLTSLSPASGASGTSVTINGSNFGASQGSSAVRFNGVTATVTSWTASQIVATVPSGATSGSVVVTVGGVASNGLSFSVTAPPPGLPSPWMSQNIGSPSLLGTATHLSGTFTTSGAGIDIWNTNDQFNFVYQPLNGNGEIVARVNSIGNTDPAAKAGVMIRETLTGGATHVMSLVSSGSGMTVQRRATSGGSATADYGFTGAAPQWVRLVRNGNTFTGYYSATGSTWTLMDTVNVTMTAQVYVGLAVTSHNPVSLTTATFSNVTVTSGSPPPPAPSITSLSPTSGLVGTSVTISGANFGSSQGASTVRFNGTTATPTSWSASSIVAPVPAGATSGSVTVTVNGTASNGSTFTVTTPPPSTPVITSLSPASGAVGTSVTIAGSNFGSTKGTSTVRFNGTTATPTSWSASSIVAPVPAGATSGSVTVTVNGTASNGSTFTVTVPPPAPVLTSLSPTSGAVGASVTIAGSNFGSTQGTSTVRFNGVTAAVTSWSASSIVAPVPTGATSGSVTVTVNGTASNGSTFTVTTPPPPAPVITSLSPASGAVGTAVTIAGSNFGSTQGTSTVRFNGVTAAVTSWSSTSIVAPVPASATTGNVVVTVGGVASGGWTFSVTAPAGLPASWTSQDIGSPSLAGTASHSSGTFTVSGAGSDIWNSSDQFNFVYQPLNGNGEIIARVNSLGSTDLWAKAGVMIREDLTAGARNVISDVTSANGPTFQRRITPGATTTSASGFTGAAPLWVRLVRTGNTFTGYYSPTGSSWTQMGTIDVAMATQVYVGLAVTSHNVSQLTTASFSSVSVTSGTPTPPVPSITTLSPSTGTVGTPVTISGSNFGASQGSSSVRFNGTTATPTSWNASSIVVPVPSGATSGPVTVTVNGTVSNGSTFTVTTVPPPAPVITSLSPGSGAVGTSVTIAGSNFGSTQGTSTVRFNGTAASPTSWGASSILVPVPGGATTGAVVVTVNGQASNGPTFTVPVAPPATITLKQDRQIDAGTVQSSSLAFNSSVTSGDLLAVVIRAGLTNQTFTVTDSRGRTYAEAARKSGFDHTVAIYYTANTTGGANTVTVSQGTSSALRFVILEFSGVATTSPLDVSGTSSGWSSSPSASATTTTGGALLLGAVASSAARTYTAASGYTVAEAVSAAPDTRLLAEWKLQSGSGSTSAGATLSSSTLWSAAIAAFKPASAGGSSMMTLGEGDSASASTLSAAVEGATGVNEPAESSDQRPARVQPPASDYDGDGRADPATYRPSTGRWRVLTADSNYTEGLVRAWGTSSDVRVPGDYDGDGKTDLAYYRPSTGSWSILTSGSGLTQMLDLVIGGGLETPVPADYDGDGATDVAVYDSKTGQWHALLSSAGFGAEVLRNWGSGSDVPVPGDYDGDGKADPAIYSPATGEWKIMQSTTDYAATGSVKFGSAGDVPVPADFDGDGTTDAAVFRPSTAEWRILRSTDGTTTSIKASAAGTPLPLDFDGDGKADLSTFQGGVWRVQLSSVDYAPALSIDAQGNKDVPLPTRP